MDSFVLVMIVVAVLAVLAIFGGLQERRRRDALAQLARKLGLSFSPGKNFSLPKQIAFIEGLRAGSNRYAFNVMEGDYRGYPALIFDFHYETKTQSKNGTSTHHHYDSYCMLRHPLRSAALYIYPETFMSRIGQAFGAADIDFESDEFSRAFVVKSPDKKLAYDLCHPRMMELLLKHRKLSVEIENGLLATGYTGRMLPQSVESRLALVAEIRSHFPQYLLKETDNGLQ